ncbi:MAG: Uma2 family endonuclease [Cyanobacteriota bacterium]|jgi:Uma2 family endonuclease
MIALVEKPPGPTLADFQSHPPEDQEWVEGRLIAKNNMTILHSKVQSRLARLWGNYILESGQGGEVYVELPCITAGRGRRPDVCYTTAELVAQFGQETVLPQSPSLAAEIASPNDSAEELFAKSAEYLASGCGEVWLVFPENCRVLIVTANQTLAFQGEDSGHCQRFLVGFQVALPSLFS